MHLIKTVLSTLIAFFLGPESTDPCYKKLYWAARNQKVEEVRTLLRCGIPAHYYFSTSSTTDAYETPLHAAARHSLRDSKVVELLIEYGASVNATDYWGKTPLNVADDAVIPILLDHGAYIEQPKKWWNPFGAYSTDLHTAAITDNTELIRELLIRGASPVEKNSYGQTPYECTHTLEAAHIMRTGRKLEVYAALRSSKKTKHRSIFCPEISKRIAQYTVQAEMPLS